MNMRTSATRALWVISLLIVVVFPASSGENDNPGASVRLLWSLTFDERVRLADVSRDTSLLAVLTSLPQRDASPRFLYAVDKEGRVLWKKRAEAGEWHVAQVSPDGRFVCGIIAETVVPNSDWLKYTSFLFDASGNELWRKDGAEVQGYPTFSPDSTYLVYRPPSTGAGPVHLVNVQGTVVAGVDVEVAYPYRFFFTPDGGYVFFSTNKGAIGIDRSGKVVWEDSPDTFVAALSPDGAYLVLGHDYHFSDRADAISCLDAEKKVVWTRDFGEKAYCDVLGFAGDTGHVLLKVWQEGQYRLWLVNPSGEIVWQRSLGKIDCLAKFDANTDGSLALMVIPCREQPGQTARIFSPLTDTTIWKAIWPPGTHYCLSADGHYLATGCQTELSLYSVAGAAAPSSDIAVPEPARTTIPSPCPCPSQG